MAGKGPTPKPDDQRRRRNAMPDQTVLPAGGFTGEAPPLAGSRGYLRRTRAWYRTWATSPQAATFIATDWLYLQETAQLVDSFFRGDLKVAAELRLRCAKLGATLEDRMRLRMTLGEAEVGVGAPERSAASADRRQRVLKAVGGDAGA